MSDEGTFLAKPEVRDAFRSAESASGEDALGKA
jgi:hypothetical protein